MVLLGHFLPPYMNTFLKFAPYYEAFSCLILCLFDRLVLAWEGQNMVLLGPVRISTF